MPNIFCPKCRMQLALPEQMIGQNVRCPGCKSIFMAEAPVPVLVPILAEAEPEPLDFNRGQYPEESTTNRVRLRSLTQPAVFWLQCSGTLFVITIALAGIRSLAALGNGNAAYMVGSWMSMIVLGVVASFVWRAVYNLQILQGRGFIIAAAILAIIVASLQLLAGLGTLSQADRMRGDDALALLVALILLASGAVHMVAGIRALVAVNNREVAQAFR